jgi:hypothetical protein
MVNILPTVKPSVPKEILPNMILDADHYIDIGKYFTPSGHYLGFAIFSFLRKSIIGYKFN